MLNEVSNVMIEVADFARVKELGIEKARDPTVRSHKILIKNLSDYLISDNPQPIIKDAREIEVWEVYNGFDGKKGFTVVPIEANVSKLKISLVELMKQGFSVTKVGGDYVHLMDDAVSMFSDRLVSNGRAAIYGCFKHDKPEGMSEEAFLVWDRSPEVLQSWTDIYFDETISFGIGYRFGMSGNDGKFLTIAKGLERA